MKEALERYFSNLTIDQQNEIMEYEKSINELVHNSVTVSFSNKGSHHGLLVLTKILEHATEEVRMMIDCLSGPISGTLLFQESLKGFLAKGKKLRVIIRKEETGDTSGVFKLISSFENAVIKIADEHLISEHRKLLPTTPYNFVVGDNSMFRMEMDNSGKGICNFNDNRQSSHLAALFDILFDRARQFEGLPILLYSDTLIEKKCRIITPDFENINIELLEYFSRNPGDLPKLSWRKFEMLLDAIFKNQGYDTVLGPGSGDGGVDLRLIQKDSIGQVLTLVQAKKYKMGNPINLEAVQALTAVVDKEKANRGLFVTTSTYLPSVKAWEMFQPQKIILANSDDVATWCRDIVKNR